MWYSSFFLIHMEKLLLDISLWNCRQICYMKHNIIFHFVLIGLFFHDKCDVSFEKCSEMYREQHISGFADM